MWKTFKEKEPKPHTWVNVLIGETGKTQREYFVGIVNDIPTFSENEEMEYVYPCGEEGITHWLDN